MKTSKAALHSPAQEECGVWLDTVQLKGKAKQKRLARPISKLLNPFAEGGGYSLAVALNFTQTKIEMPKTQQSSISTFFTSHRRVLNKMSSSEVPNLDPVQPLSSPTFTAPTTVASVRKRRHSFKMSDICEPGVGHKRQTENGTEIEGTLWQKQATHLSSLLNGCCEFKENEGEECKPPQSKRRPTGTASLPNDSQLSPLAWSQDPLLTYSQYPESEIFLTDQKTTTAKNFSSSWSSFLDYSQSDEAFGNLIDVEGRTSTQKPLKNPPSSKIENEKENSRPRSFNSPSKHPSFTHLGHLSNDKWTDPKSTSPQKNVDHLRSATGSEVPSDLKWTKASNSPLKKLQQRSREVDENSWAMLFTQDSEGFRVIAHGGLQTRSPLKDQSNQSTEVMRVSAYKSMVEEEEEEDDEMLFTQDSQGNMVIKH
ncbi:aurora kinase A- and ninein-interacting protein isoform 1-T2 [Odontesthes bonariensis]|uniref:aurora kinase A- and ninein-interacting protein n=1 Tax=Odontesthes bonariensis TaxID=219752 RepID=UPI003F580D1D